MVTIAAEQFERVCPIVDSNVHLWNQATDPVFWLSDRAMLHDLLGDYDALPDRYALTDYLETTRGFDVTGAVWSDPGAADPFAALEEVRAQNTHGMIVGLVTLADPFAPEFDQFITRLTDQPLVTSVRMRLVGSLRSETPGAPRRTDDDALLHSLELVANAGLVATIEASGDQLERVTAAAGLLPDVRIVVDHFGWPLDLSGEGRAAHLARLDALAAHQNVATRIDAIGTVFGSWSVEQIAPWLTGTVERFGAERCMLGSDMPIETLRSDFRRLYSAYDEIFTTRSHEERGALFGATARRWLAAT